MMRRQFVEIAGGAAGDWAGSRAHVWVDSSDAVVTPLFVVAGPPKTTQVAMGLVRAAVAEAVGDAQPYVLVGIDLPGTAHTATCDGSPVVAGASLRAWVLCVAQILSGVANPVIIGVGTASGVGTHSLLPLPHAPADVHAALGTALQPVRSGSHVVAAFDHVRSTHMFSPWWHTDSRVQEAMPTDDQLHDATCEVLQAGGHYAQLLGALAELPEAPPFGESMIGHGSLVLPNQPVGTVGGVQRVFVDLPGHGDKQVHLRIVRPLIPSMKPPLLALMASPGSAASLEQLMLGLGHDRVVIAPDTPGNGDSSPPSSDSLTIRNYAEMLMPLLDHELLQSPTGQVDVFGTHTGGLIGIEMCLARPDRIRRFVMDGITMFTDDEREDILANYLPPVPASAYGSQFVTLWGMRRDMYLFWPWYNRTVVGARGAEPPLVTENMAYLDLLRSGPTFAWSYRAAFSYDTAASFPSVTQPTLLTSSVFDPLAPYNEVARAMRPSTEVQFTNGVGPLGAATAAEIFRAFLDQP
jgi:pimeloyl-ACP methyl ester carboxylesterase